MYKTRKHDDIYIYIYNGNLQSTTSNWVPVYGPQYSEGRRERPQCWNQSEVPAVWNCRNLRYLTDIFTVSNYYMI